MAKLEVLSPGPMSMIQDLGRPDWRSHGVPLSGAADAVALRLGNALLGNDQNTAAIEFRLAGPRLRAVEGPVRIALCGNVNAQVEPLGGSAAPLQSWQSHTLREGDVLSVKAVAHGVVGYIAIEGGIEVPEVLGSRATYTRAGLGGLQGAPLQPGQMLPVNSTDMKREAETILPDPPAAPSGKATLRVVLGPQDDYFAPETLEQFCTQDYRVSQEADRMGVRLEGEPLAHLPEKGSDLVSEGLVPGAIQVPGNGQPIMLFVDCQTIGGYPKIATVISADLHLIGQLAPGNTLRFKAVSLEEAIAARKALEADIEKRIAGIRDFYGEGAMDLKALYNNNLIDGAVNAALPGHFPGSLEDAT